MTDPTRNQKERKHNSSGPRGGWAPRGRRLIDKVPHGRWKTWPLRRCDRVEAPCLFDGPINGERFLAYDTKCLSPTLKPDDIVVADNLGSRKGKAVQKAIRSAGARLLFLPKYSPDPQSHRAGLRQIDNKNV